MSRIIKAILFLNLTAIAVLAFAYPHLMISPGELIGVHHASETDCFACHDIFLGASSEKCIACHKVADIGVRTTKGIPVAANKTKVPFHQKLQEQNCVACHSDHTGVMKFRTSQRFSHDLLDTATHKQCATCHQKPRDRLHKQVSDTCSQCHGTDTWKPATFDHNKFFVFDKDHPATCAVCHTTTSYKEYTCYGCHEHSPAKIREEHMEEGIRDFENCVKCHRSADEDEAERAWNSIRRGIPYQFGTPTENRDEKLEKEDRD